MTDDWIERKDEYLEKFQRIIVVVLSWTMAVVVFFATIELIYDLARYLIYPTIGLLEIKELLGFFGSILLVLIGVELLETFKAFRLEKSVNVLTVLMVAMIAMARKIIMVELGEPSDNVNLVGVAAIIIALSVGYYLVMKARSEERKQA
jgi:uncharacterized membrane protein (DUF373 family)